jgi:hypothetical protein
MTEATNAEYRALHAICDRAGVAVMTEAASIGALPAVSLRCMIIHCVCTMEDHLGKDVVAPFLRALAENVLQEGDPESEEALNAAGQALDARQADVRAAATGSRQ